MQRRLIDFIRRPDSMDQQTIAMLKSMKDEHPYFHSARILLLQALYKHHSPLFDEELRSNAALLPDRQAIFHLTEEPNYQKNEERKKFNTDEETETDKSERTDTLITNFLNNQPQEQMPTGRYPIDATQDYIGFLLQNEMHDEETPDMPMNGGGVVEDFLNQEPTRIVLNETEANTENLTEKEENEEDNEILTETLAGIYIKQGKFENAIKIIRQLSLKYPKKNRYFADQIRFLEKLIINNKNK